MFEIRLLETIDDLKRELESEHRKIACENKIQRYETLTFLEDIGYTVALGVDAYAPEDSDFVFPYPGIAPDGQVACHNPKACRTVPPIPYDTVKTLMTRFYKEETAVFDENIMVLLGNCV